jgi:hypothetical protein
MFTGYHPLLVFFVFILSLLFNFARPDNQYDDPYTISYIPIVYRLYLVHPTPTPTITPTKTIYITYTPYRTYTPYPTNTITPTLTLTPTLTFTPTNTHTSTYMPFPSITLLYMSQTPTKTITPTQVPSATITPTVAGGINIQPENGRTIALILVGILWVLLAAWLIILIRRGQSPE